MENIHRHSHTFTGEACRKYGKNTDRGLRKTGKTHGNAVILLGAVPMKTITYEERIREYRHPYTSSGASFGSGASSGGHNTPESPQALDRGEVSLPLGTLGTVLGCATVRTPCERKRKTLSNPLIRKPRPSDALSDSGGKRPSILARPSGGSARTSQSRTNGEGCRGGRPVGLNHGSHLKKGPALSIAGPFFRKGALID